MREDGKVSFRIRVIFRSFDQMLQIRLYSWLPIRNRGESFWRLYVSSIPRKNDEARTI